MGYQYLEEVIREEVSADDAELPAIGSGLDFSDAVTMRVVVILGGTDTVCTITPLVANGPSTDYNKLGSTDLSITDGERQEFELKIDGNKDVNFGITGVDGTDPTVEILASKKY